MEHNTCPNCKECMGYYAHVDWYECNIYGFIPSEIATDEDRPCDKFRGINDD